MILQGVVILVVVMLVGAVVGVAGRWLLDTPRGEDLETGLVWRGLQLYARVVHRLRVEGLEHVPQGRDAGPLIVVSNHTSGADPLLVQAALRFEVRWLMAADMMVGLLGPLWRWSGVIGVDRSGRDRRSVLEGVRHLREGGVIGVFPEGGIERPAQHVLPFHGGVGFFVKKTGARVLPVIIDGTPYASTAYGSLHRRSRARLRFLEPIDYSGSGLDAGEIAQDLQQRFLDATGWAFNDSPDPSAIHA